MPAKDESDTGTLPKSTVSAKIVSLILVLIKLPETGRFSLEPVSSVPVIRPVPLVLSTETAPIKKRP